MIFNRNHEKSINIDKNRCKSLNSILFGGPIGISEIMHRTVHRSKGFPEGDVWLLSVMFQGTFRLTSRPGNYFGSFQVGF